MSDPNRDKHRQAVKVLRNLDSKYHSNPDKHRQTVELTYVKGINVLFYSVGGCQSEM